MTLILSTEPADVVKASRSFAIHIISDLNAPDVILINRENFTMAASELVGKTDRLNKEIQVIVSDRADQIVVVDGVKLSLAQIMAFLGQFCDDVEAGMNK